MRVTVCELPDEATRRVMAWSELVRYLRGSPTEVLVLPEMPFVDWTIFMSQTVDPIVWRRVLAEHDAMILRLNELDAKVVLSSRPIQTGRRRLNQAFAWTPEAGYVGGRSKFYLPDEPDGRETTWFDPGELDLSPLATTGVRAGFQLCTEMLFTDLAWQIGRAGAQLIAAPRATGGHRRWTTAASLSAIVSGCFVASANRRSYESDVFAGQSWIVSPEGEILVETTAGSPFATIDIDLGQADVAKQTYPRNLQTPSSVRKPAP